MSTPPKARWFFLRGLVREAGHWGKLPEVFKESFPQTEVHCLEIPGNGVAWRAESPTSVSGIVDALRSELSLRTAMSPEVPNFFLAISLGGMVAVDWVNRFPGDVHGAVLINTSLRGISPFLHRLTPRSWLSLGKILFERDVMTREALILKLTSSVRLRDANVISDRARLYRTHPISRLNALRQLIAAARFQAPEKKPNVPILLLNSLGDKMVNPACSEGIARAWGVELIRHPTAGHDLPLDDPQWLVDCVRTWWEKLGEISESR